MLHLLYLWRQFLSPFASWGPNQTQIQSCASRAMPYFAAHLAAQPLKSPATCETTAVLRQSKMERFPTQSQPRFWCVLCVCFVKRSCITPSIPSYPSTTYGQFQEIQPEVDLSRPADAKVGNAGTETMTQSQSCRMIYRRLQTQKGMPGCLMKLQCSKGPFKCLCLTILNVHMASML